MKDLEAVEAEVRLRMFQLGAPVPRFRFEQTPIGDATPHIENTRAKDGVPVYDWVISERGTEYDRKAVDGPELLFITLDSLTCSIAQNAELGSRVNNYSRWTWMQAHIVLMTRLDPVWGNRVARHYDEVLLANPLSAEERAFSRNLGF